MEKMTKGQTQYIVNLLDEKRKLLQDTLHLGVFPYGSEEHEKMHGALKALVKTIVGLKVEHSYCDAVSYVLSSYHIFADCEEDFENEKMLVVRIENGDWKHSHCLFKNLLDEDFNVKDLSIENEDSEDGGDCYTATYTIEFA